MLEKRDNMTVMYDKQVKEKIIVLSLKIRNGLTIICQAISYLILENELRYYFEILISFTNLILRMALYSGDLRPNNCDT